MKDTFAEQFMARRYRTIWHAPSRRRMSVMKDWVHDDARVSDAIDKRERRRLRRSGSAS